MFLPLLAQLVGPDERVGAVHRHFAGRSSADGLQVIVAVVLMAVLLCGVLLLLHRVEQQKQRRKEERRARRRRELTAPRQEAMSLKHRKLSTRRT